MMGTEMITVGELDRFAVLERVGLAVTVKSVTFTNSSIVKFGYAFDFSKNQAK